MQFPWFVIFSIEVLCFLSNSVIPTSLFLPRSPGRTTLRDAMSWTVTVHKLYHVAKPNNVFIFLCKGICDAGYRLLGYEWVCSPLEFHIFCSPLLFWKIWILQPKYNSMVGWIYGLWSILSSALGAKHLVSSQNSEIRFFPKRELTFQNDLAAEISAVRDLRRYQLLCVIENQQKQVRWQLY